MDLKTDYLIVGAGPAGCLLAWELRQAGREVLVLERCDAATKDKLCGGALGAPALRILEAQFGASALERLELTNPPRLVIRSLDHEVTSAVTFATLPRKRLDTYLLDRCLQAGAGLRDRTSLVSVDEHARLATCTDLRTGEAVRIHYGTLIGADGAVSAVRRLLTNHKSRVAISLAGSVPVAGNEVVFEFNPGHQGYCWYIPNNRDASVGCMLHSGSVQDCRDWVMSFCGELGIDAPHLRGAPIPSGADVLLRAGEDVWLVGDAAGLVRPTDGGGIHYALESAHALATSLLGGEPYEQAMEPTLTFIAKNAKKIGICYLVQSLQIARKGHTCPSSGD